MKLALPLCKRIFVNFPDGLNLPVCSRWEQGEPGRRTRGRSRGAPASRALFAVVVLFAVTFILASMMLCRLVRIRPYGFSDGPRMERVSLQKLNSTFLVDTPGCRIPNLEVMSPEIREFVYDYPDVACDDPPPLVRSDDEAVYLVRENARFYGVRPDSLRCCTRALWLQQANFTLPEVEGTDNAALARVKLPPGGDAKFGDVVEYAEECTPFEESVRVPHEFVRVECESEGQEVHRDFHGFVRPRPQASRSQPRGLNVLLLGADNLSRLNLLRSMPRVEALLRRLGAVTMLGYNKVDDYSYVNLVPLLAGLPSGEMEKHCLLANSVFFDPCPWLWKAFKRAGYTTALMEDTPRLGLFHFHSPGFARRPVDVDSRALLLAAERELPRTQAGNTSPVCLGARFQVERLFDLSRKFLRAMLQSGEPFFHYLWGTSVTHDHLNQAQLADPLYERFVEELVESGTLNHTALVFLSDHGNRVGGIVTTYQGHVEDRLPVLSFVLPPWFHRKYPHAVATLRGNVRRLVTVMDVHDTLLQLLDLDSLEQAPLEAAGAAVRQRALAGRPPRSMSLFLPVPDSRTCEQAGVVPHFCACVRLAPAARDDPRVLAAAALLVDNVNEALSAYPQCARLSLHAVKDARRGEPASLVGQTQPPDRVREEEFLITFETQPGGALLAGTVRHLVAERVMRLAGRVTRLNKYGNASWCMPERQLLLYCYCAHQLQQGHDQHEGVPAVV